MRFLQLLAVLAIVGVLLAGCGDDEMSLDPPDIEYGVDMSEMGMPVVDPRFTVATLPKDSDDWLLFDDIGEFLKYHQNASSDFEVMWVPDHDSEEWLKAEDAWYVQSDEFCYSPMKWCVAAFDSEESAHEAHMEYGGEMWNWDQVFDVSWEHAPVPQDHTPEATPAEDPQH